MADNRYLKRHRKRLTLKFGVDRFKLSLVFNGLLL